MAAATTWEEVLEMILAMGGINHRRKVEILYDHALKQIEEGASTPPPATKMTKKPKSPDVVGAGTTPKKKPKKVGNAVVEGADVA